MRVVEVFVTRQALLRWRQLTLAQSRRISWR
jgi:hypothetical protein